MGIHLVENIFKRNRTGRFSSKTGSPIFIKAEYQIPFKFSSKKIKKTYDLISNNAAPNIYLPNMLIIHFS